MAHRSKIPQVLNNSMSESYYFGSGMKPVHHSNIKDVWASLTDVDGETPVSEGCSGFVLSFTEVGSNGKTDDLSAVGYERKGEAFYRSIGERGSRVYAQRSPKHMEAIKQFLQELVVIKVKDPGEAHDCMVRELQMTVGKTQMWQGLVLTATIFDAEVKQRHTQVTIWWNCDDNKSHVRTKDGVCDVTDRPMHLVVKKLFLYLSEHFLVCPEVVKHTSDEAEEEEKGV